jgi:chemotaxis protein CheD
MHPPTPVPTAGHEKKLVVGIADLIVSSDPGIALVAYGLGSSLGVAIFDPMVRAGGLLHAMLPDSVIDAAKATTHPAMFVDTGVSALFRAAYKLGAEKRRVIIAVAGAAQILDTTGCFDVGPRNFEALHRLLLKHALSIQAQQTGGLTNRTLSLHLGTGEVRVRTSGHAHETVLCNHSTTT